MAIFEEVVAGEAATGLAIGVVAIVLAPVLLPVLVNIGRPLLKGAIRGGMMLYERGQEMASELGETFEDLVAEARAEMETVEQSSQGAVAPVTKDIEAAAAERTTGGRARRKSS